MSRGAVTRTDLVVVIIALVALVLVWCGPFVLMNLNLAGDKYARVSRVKCRSNLKQINLAFRLYAEDNDGRYPWQSASSANPEYDETWKYFLTASNHLGQPKILVCPADYKRIDSQAEDFGEGTNGFSATHRRNAALSYFIGVGATPMTSSAILAGDRNLAASKEALFTSSPGGRPLHVKGKVTWADTETDRLHGNVGILVLVSGEVIEASQSKLRRTLAGVEQTYGTNANLFLFPQ